MIKFMKRFARSEQIGGKPLTQGAKKGLHPFEIQLGTGLFLYRIGGNALQPAFMVGYPDIGVKTTEAAKANRVPEARLPRNDSPLVALVPAS